MSESKKTETKKEEEKEESKENTGGEEIICRECGGKGHIS